MSKSKSKIKWMLICYHALVVSCDKCGNWVEQSEWEPRRKLYGYGFTFEEDDTFSCNTCGIPAQAVYYDENENDITAELYPEHVTPSSKEGA